MSGIEAGWGAIDAGFSALDARRPQAYVLVVFASFHTGLATRAMLSALPSCEPDYPHFVPLL